MQAAKRIFGVMALGLAVIAAVAMIPKHVTVLAQQSMPGRNADPIMPPSSPPGAMASEDPSVAGRVGQDRLEAMKIADRRNHAQKDLERMAALTSELQADFAKSNQELPADFAKKAKEVEKLAHDLQAQMTR